MRKILTIIFLHLSTLKLYAQNGDSLIVFVGEKIKTERFWPEESWDAGMHAKYKVLKVIHGRFIGDTIEFDAFDHHARFQFANYKHVLLFVSYENGKLYHEKYQYFDVYKTIDNNWASPGDPFKFDEYHKKPFFPCRALFKDTVSYQIEKFFDEETIRLVYPSKFYNRIQKRVVAIDGTYIEDLLIVKKQGVLKARGLFK